MYSLLITTLTLSFINDCGGVRCGGGDACIFMGRAHDPPWIAFADSTEASKAYIIPPSSESWKHPNASLFISIASFRDSLCPVTLFNVFTKAKFPSRITVGIVQQNAPEDVDCVEEFCNMMKKKENDVSCRYKSNIRITRIDASLARGPTFGRALGSKLLQNEEFCMQTDAHMDMVRHWDVKMMDMWGLIQNEYAILSTYVTDAAELPVLDKEDSKGINNLHEVPHLCMVHFSGTFDLVRNTDTKCARMLPRPKLNNIVWGAGLSFSKCHAERKVPYDPHTPGIFDGEEFNRGLRFWTYGYDVYTPHRVYVVHNYKKSQSDPKHAAWIMNKAASKEEDSLLSAARLKTIFGYTSGGIADAKEAERVLRSKYGLGDRRTLDQAIAFSGIDTRNRSLTANKCGYLEYVPFVPHPW